MISAAAEELRVIGKRPRLGLPNGQTKYNTPITPRENIYRFVRRENPLWIPSTCDIMDIMPAIIPDVRVRGLVLDLVPFNPLTEAGGRDMYGVEWVFVPETGGSTVKPGNPIITDIEEWKECVKAPDIGSWDWEGA